MPVSTHFLHIQNDKHEGQAKNGTHNNVADHIAIKPLNFNLNGKKKHCEVSLVSIDFNPLIVALSGFVQTLNIAHGKRVNVRYSFNHWRNFTEISAVYVGPARKSGFSLFHFEINLDKHCKIDQSFEFSIYYQVSGATYWENNGGKCYQVALVASENIANPKCQNYSFTPLTMYGYAFPSALLQKYRLVSEMGAGSFGLVCLAYCLHDGQKVAVKIIRKESIPAHQWTYDEELDSLIPKEVHILRKIHHGGIANFVELFEDQSCYFIVMEFHGTSWSKMSENYKTFLPNYIMEKTGSTDLWEHCETHGPMNEEDAKCVFRQILDVIIYLSDQQIYHGDLKIENTLIDKDKNIKIVDFGSATNVKYKDQPLTHFNGTRDYASPEIFLSSKALAYEGEPAAVWSLGVLLYRILYNRLPFSLDDPCECCFVPFRTPPFATSPESLNLLNLMLKKLPCERITLRDIKCHSWLAESEHSNKSDLEYDKAGLVCSAWF